MQLADRIAGVARSAVYLVLLTGRSVHALGRDLMGRSGYAGLIESGRAPRRARAHARRDRSGGPDVFAAERDVVRALHSMAQLDEGAVGVEVAANTLWVITSFEAFDLLFAGRGLPLEEVTRLLTTAADHALLRRVT